MKLLQVYNQYRSNFNGEEAVVSRIASLFEARGGTARLWMRTSRGLDRRLAGKIRAFTSGIYSRRSYHQMRTMLTEDRPDIVHVHNLYPLFSPSVLVACKRERVPVVMTSHNHGLTCPRSDHLRRERICEKCYGGKEYHCVLRNCRENIFESVGYALRAAVARRLRLFHDNVDVLIALTHFARSRFIDQGFAADQVEVLPNLFTTAQDAVDPGRGEYVAYAGRMSGEKGVDTLLQAAARLPHCPFRLAGDGPLLESLKRNATENVRFVGHVDRGEMESFYRGARFVVVPSRCFEMCPLVIAEAMSLGLPVVASRTGGLAELVSDGVNGLLFEPDDAEDLERKLRLLWNSPAFRRSLAEQAHETARRFDEDTYFRRLMEIYDKARFRAGGDDGRPTEPSDSDAGSDRLVSC